MKTTQNTVLVTGGSAGIGFEIARLFAEAGNKVIITGRNEERLTRAARQLGDHVIPIVNDVSREEEIVRLADRIRSEFPDLNIVVNNAGRAFVHDLLESEDPAALAREEMQTNFFSIMSLNKRLLPVLNQQPEAAIVNVSSIVAFVPGKSLSTYSASKAALHSYTKSLRLFLEQPGNVKVFELMPPLVNTEFSKEIGGEHGIPPQEVAAALLEAIRTDQYEVRVGNTEQMYQLYRSSPADALAAMNGQ